MLCIQQCILYYFLNFSYLSPMNIEELRAYCLAKKVVTESFPFDEDTLVFKVANKMFALTSLSKWEEGEPSLNLKCEPQRAIHLRQEYAAILPGYHMSKKHWNTVTLYTTISDTFLCEMIDDSYNLIVGSLPQKVQKEIENL